MNINMLLWWSLGRGNTVVPSRWQATADQRPQMHAAVAARGSTNQVHSPRELCCWTCSSHDSSFFRVGLSP